MLVRVTTLERKYPGGLEGFRRRVGERAFCSDGELVRASFVHPADARDLGYHLDLVGLTRADASGHYAVDFALVQGFWPTLTCGWLTVYPLLPGASPDAAAFVTKTGPGILATPTGGGSLPGAPSSEPLMWGPDRSQLVTEWADTVRAWDEFELNRPGQGYGEEGMVAVPTGTVTWEDEAVPGYAFSPHEVLAVTVISYEEACGREGAALSIGTKHFGTLVRRLVEDGDAVVPGQPLAEVLYRTPSTDEYGEALSRTSELERQLGRIRSVLEG